MAVFDFDTRHTYINALEAYLANPDLTEARKRDMYKSPMNVIRDLQRDRIFPHDVYVDSELIDAMEHTIKDTLFRELAKEAAESTDTDLTNTDTPKLQKPSESTDVYKFEPAGKPTNYNKITLATINEIKSTKGQLKADWVYDKLTEKEGISGILSQYEQANLLQMIEYVIEHRAECESKKTDLLNTLLVDTVMPRCIVDTGEFILWEKTHYRLGGKENKIKMTGLLHEYEPDITEKQTNAAFFRLMATSKLHIQRDELNQQNGRAFANGWVDYTTGELQEITPDRLNIAHIAFDIELPDAQESEYTIQDIEAWLGKDSVINAGLQACHTRDGKLDVENYYSVFEGDALAIFANDQKMRTHFIHHGPTNTGKSTHLNFLTALLGKNATSIPLQELANDKFKRARLFGKLANVFADLDNMVLKQGQGTVKAMLSGDPITAEYKGYDSFEFKPTATHHYSTNEFPASYDQTDAWFDRYKIIDWSRQFADKDKDRNLLDKMLADKGGIARYLGLLFRIYQKIQVRGDIRYKDAPSKNREKWNDNADPVGRYWREAVIHYGDDEARVNTAKFNDYFNVWATVNGYPPKTLKTLNKEIRDLGIQSMNTRVCDRDANGKVTKTYAGMAWCGIDVKPAYKYDTIDAYNEAKNIEQ